MRSHLDTRSLELLLAQAVRDGVKVRGSLIERCGREIVHACGLMVDTLMNGSKVLFCGNGGSAADAQHLAAELVGRYVSERRGLPGIALTVDTSILTAVANDYGFERVFARQVEALGVRGDLLVAITTSGNSPNIRAAVEAARTKGMKVLGLTGEKGRSFAGLCDVGIAVPSTVTSRVQECHITIGHILCEAVDILMTTEDDTHSDLHSTPEFVTASKKEITRTDLNLIRRAASNDKRTIVWTNGVFDIFHAGHLAQLKAARAFGDILIVGVNTDETVKASKGADRPIFPLAERMEMLAALEVVDFVHPFSEPTPLEALRVLRPDVHCKGADYADKPIPERSFIESYGGRVALIPLVEGRSTSRVVELLKK